VVEVIWTEPALNDLDQIAEFIAIENPKAASDLVVSVFEKVDRLLTFPDSGRKVPELPQFWYREVIVNPCRVIYRQENETLYVVHVVRQERKIRLHLIETRE
jgi:toxin ParE1/3/4